MLLATPENKRKAFDLIDKISPTGSTDPIPALDLAFKQGAELIYLLTDGDFPDNKATVDEIHRLNPGKLVRINTIAFMDHDEGYENLLHKIADENGGAFRFFSEDEAERDMAK
jgi:hypothetical protein